MRSTGPPAARWGLGGPLWRFPDALVLFAGNGACRVGATAIALAAAGAVAAGPPPSGEEAMEAWRQVEGWVRSWTPPEDDGAGIGAPVEGAPGVVGPVGVTLRYNGMIIGRGLDVSGAPGALARAAAQAIHEGDARLPVDADALLLEPVETIAADVAISLELGGTPEALPVRTLAEVAGRLSPGLEGVIVRVGDRQAGMLPGMMLATGTDASSATAIAFREVAGERARALAGPALDPATAAAEMLERRDAAVYRVRVTHLAQTRAGQAPLFLYRGGRIVPVEAMDTGAMRRWSASMAAFLLGRKYPGAERLGMMGALNPIDGRSEEVVAPPAQQAVAALALMRYSNLERADPELASACAIRATGLLRDLAVVEESEVAPWAATHDAAAVVIALLEIEPSGVFEDALLKELLAQCAPVVAGAYSPLRGFDEEVAQGAEGLVAWALVRLMKVEGSVDSGVARAAVRSVYLEAGAEGLVTHMPWLWWAEAELAGRDGEVGAAAALRAARDVVWQHQLDSADVDAGTRDFEGGMVFTGAGPALPTWNTARPLAAMASMLGDERVTPDGEFLAEFNRVRAGLRFLRQLTADEATGHMYRNPARAAGGVRAAPWDQSMPPDATTLSLLCVVETLEAMEAYLARQGE